MTWLEKLTARLAVHLGKKLDVLSDKRAFDAAQDARDAGDLKTALDGFEKLALRGHGLAAALAGGMHINGQGTVINGAKSVKFLEMGRDAGNPEAIALLGMAYASGMPGIKVDYFKARPLLEIAVKNGDKDAQQWLDSVKAKQKNKH